MSHPSCRNPAETPQKPVISCRNPAEKVQKPCRNPAETLADLLQIVDF
jgi:hypothetical protein